MEPSNDPDVAPVILFANRFTVKLPLASAYRPVPPVMVFVSTMDTTSGSPVVLACPEKQVKIVSPLAAINE
jgi:hypothetical protein